MCVLLLFNNILTQVLESQSSIRKGVSENLRDARFAFKVATNIAKHERFGEES